MEMGPFDVTTGSDRFSTCDEIRAALSSFPDFLLESPADSLWEVESDLGGRVLIETEEADTLKVLEKLDTTVN
ncbi:MAG TPA: hypothetical protein VKV15_14125 [Bryobacteraceae bacterium]|nr:hypothetical protein [Bryobacteraceae bacterium]